MKRIKGAVLVLAALLIGLFTCGCGVNLKSPEGVVKSLLEAYEKGKTKAALECYGMTEKDADEATKEEVAANISYFRAHKAKDMELEDCRIIEKFDEYAYVYAVYKFQLEEKRSYPAISTYLVTKKDKKYHILPAKDVGEDLAKKVQEIYQEFMKSDAYSSYTKQYDAFMTQYPAYEEQLASRLEQESSKEESPEQESSKGESSESKS